MDVSSLDPLNERLIAKVIPNFVTNEESVMLTAIPTRDEVWAAIFDMDPASAPDPDGFTGIFFRFAWEVNGSIFAK